MKENVTGKRNPAEENDNACKRERERLVIYVGLRENENIERI